MKLFCKVIILFFVLGSTLAHAVENQDSFYENNINSILLPEQREPSNENVFIFDPKKLVWAVYNKEGQRIGLGKASGGKKYCPDTKRSCKTTTGTFAIYLKGGAKCASMSYPVDKGGAPMPYCMFFYKGLAIHGSQNITDENESHGCIHVSPAAAKWMSQHALAYQAKVIVLPYS